MSWNHLFGGMMNFNPGGLPFPANAHQIVTMQQNVQQGLTAAQHQQQQQQMKREQQPTMVVGQPQQQQQQIQQPPQQQQAQPSSNVNAASAAAAAAAAAQNMEFMATIQNKDLLEELKVASQAIVHKTITNGLGDGKQQMIRHYRCNRHRHQEKCPFKMLAIQSEDTTFKVFKSGDHNHAVVPSGRAPSCRGPGGQRTNWIPMQTVRTADELETLRQAQRVTVHKTTFHGKNRHFRCNRHRHNERCMFKLLAVTENTGVISVFRSGEHNHPIQQITNCVY